MVLGRGIKNNLQRKSQMKKRKKRKKPCILILPSASETLRIDTKDFPKSKAKYDKLFSIASEQITLAKTVPEAVQLLEDHGFKVRFQLEIQESEDGPLKVIVPRFS